VHDEGDEGEEGEEGVLMGELMAMALDACEDDVEAADYMTAHALSQTPNGNDVRVAKRHVAHALEETIAAKRIGRVWRAIAHSKATYSKVTPKVRSSSTLEVHQSTKARSPAANHSSEEQEMLARFVRSTGEDAATAKFYVRSAAEQGLGVGEAISHYMRIEEEATTAEGDETSGYFIDP
jgi:hypothetical protein